MPGRWKFDGEEPTLAPTYGDADHAAAVALLPRRKESDVEALAREIAMTCTRLYPGLDAMTEAVAATLRKGVGNG